MKKANSAGGSHWRVLGLGVLLAVVAYASARITAYNIGLSVPYEALGTAVLLESGVIAVLLALGLASARRRFGTAPVRALLSYALACVATAGIYVVYQAINEGFGYAKFLSLRTIAEEMVLGYRPAFFFILWMMLFTFLSRRNRPNTGSVLVVPVFVWGLQSVQQNWFYFHSGHVLSAQLVAIGAIASALALGVVLVTLFAWSWPQRIRIPHSGTLLAAGFTVVAVFADWAFLFLMISAPAP